MEVQICLMWLSCMEKVLQERLFFDKARCAFESGPWKQFVHYLIMGKEVGMGLESK